MRKRTPNRRTAAFTLVELILVIVIIGILAAVIIPKFLSQIDKAKVANAKANLTQLNTSLSAFMASGGAWPTDEPSLTAALKTKEGGGLPEYPENPLLPEAADRRKVKVIAGAIPPAAAEFLSFDELTAGWIYIKVVDATGKVTDGRLYINSKDADQRKW